MTTTTHDAAREAEVTAALEEHEAADRRRTSCETSLAWAAASMIDRLDRTPGRVVDEADITVLRHYRAELAQAEHRHRIALERLCVVTGVAAPGGAR